MSESISMSGDKEDTPVDIVIITALKKERNAILERLEAVSEPIHEQQHPITYYRGRIPIPATDEHYSVALVLLQDVGNIEAGIATTYAVARWRASLVLMVGIGGGVQGKVGLGDVVVARYVYYYEPGKATSSGIQHRSEQYWSDSVLFHRAFMYEATDWKGDVRKPIPGGDIRAWKPEAHFGPIGSGEQVIGDRVALEELLDDCPKMLAVAMEGAGVAKAARYAAGQTKFLEIRGISDFADAHKGDDWQDVAADAAAAFAVGLLRTRPFPPRTATTGSISKQPQPSTSLLILKAESLRQIGSAEVIAGLPHELQERDLTTVSLDFTDLVGGGEFRDPEEAVRRLTGPKSPLLSALAERTDSEIVFCGLAHIPLVVLTGHILTDRQKVHLLDFHPSPDPETWGWPTAGGDYPALVVSRVPRKASRAAGDAVIRISISYVVHPDQTEAVVRNPAVSLDIRLPEPTRGVVRSEAQLRQYGRVFRQALDRVAQDFPAVGRVHLFYAGPVSLAFHIGQQISENIHPPVISWNYSRPHYDWGIDLGAAITGEDAVLRAPAPDLAHSV